MEDSVHYRILEECRDAILAASFDGFGDQPGIPEEHIVFRHTPLIARDPGEEKFRDEGTPGILISPGSIKRASSAGTNEQDDGMFFVAFQVIDRGDARMYQDQLRSHLLWCQLITRALHGMDWGLITTGDSCPILSWTEETSDLDDGMFIRHQYFVRAVVARIWVREPRGL